MAVSDAAASPDLRAPGLRSLTEELRAHLARVRLGGDERSRNRHLARGKLLPRERIDP